ncbi:phage portal protein [Paenibacillus thiaminolyticus]|uniref:phage portal protein n=1 Tax=Paenibacillus thiaminolyticus TaxID=49283 RepID=UPI002350A448|nr:phage portal protein [Paenibacillus thiaminolyticus]WCR29724.1 phage portal protein [Paenibacillus thiaminolyticus]
MSFLESVFKRNSELESLFDLDLLYDSTSRSYLKKMAIETCINFVGRTISQSDFRIMKDKHRIRDDWDYLLNVRPNTDQSAAEFWQQLVYRLIFNNEVLVVLSDSNDLLIADSFSREEYAVFPDVFKDVTVKDYTFKRVFRMDEVIHMTYNNEKLSKFMDGMFEDYSELFTRMIETQKLSNQIRGTVGIDSTHSLDEAQRTKLQTFIDRLFTSFKKNAIALVPKLKGFEYNEVNKGDNNGKSVEELAKLKRDLTNDVANILGIPNSLIHGDMSEYETAIKAYIKFCISPLTKKIHDELNAKIIQKSEYMNGKRIEVHGIAELNPLEIANAVDKLRASGVYNGNEIRIKLGDEPVDNPALEEYVLTKNYQSAQSVEGGDTNNA